MGMNTGLEVFGGADTTITPYALQEAIGAYSDEAYTNAKKLSSTDIVGSNSDIETSSETYIGQLRWFKPMNPVINVASLTDDTDGTPSTYGSSYLNYVKSVRTYGGEKINLSKVVTQVDGLSKIGRDFGEHRAQDEHDAILSVLKGVAISELMYGAAQAGGDVGLGGQSFDNDPDSKRYGFYVDLGVEALMTDAGLNRAGGANSAYVGAQRAQGFLEAFGMAYKDYEPAFAYLVTSPAVMASLRSANLIDSDRVTDGNMDFSTLFQGKFRLIQTRATQSLLTSQIAAFDDSNSNGVGVDLVGNLTSYLVLPGSLAMEALQIDEDVEIDRHAAAYKGGGKTEIWHRWGYVVHPAGYSWAGSQEKFPSNAEYTYVTDGEDFVSIQSLNSTALAGHTGVWKRKVSSALSLGILPIFHS